MDEVVIKKKLMIEIKKIERVIIDLKVAATPVAPENSIGRLTRMEAMSAQKISKANLDDANVKLLKLEQALKRVDAGDYGECLVCGDEISSKRLQAVPETVSCIVCAERSGS